MMTALRLIQVSAKRPRADALIEHLNDTYLNVDVGALEPLNRATVRERIAVGPDHAIGRTLP